MDNFKVQVEVNVEVNVMVMEEEENKEEIMDQTNHPSGSGAGDPPSNKNIQDGCLICLGVLKDEGDEDDELKETEGKGQSSNQARAGGDVPDGIGTGIPSTEILPLLCKLLGITPEDVSGEPFFDSGAAMKHLFCQDCLGMLEKVNLLYEQKNLNEIEVQNALKAYRAQIEDGILASSKMLQLCDVNGCSVGAVHVRWSFVSEILRLREIADDDSSDPPDPGADRNDLLQNPGTAKANFLN